MSNQNEQQWERVQEQVFTKWINSLISQKGIINNIKTGLTPFYFKEFVETLIGKSIGKKLNNGKGRIYDINNYSEILNFLKENNNEIIGCSAENMADSESGYKFILGMMFSLYRKYCICRSVSDESNNKFKTGNKIDNMIWNWVNEKVKGYGLYVDNPSTSFGDGRILLALVDNFMGKEIYQSYQNCSNEERVKKAIEMAHENMGIEELFSVDEIVKCQTDERAMMLYISLFSQVFKTKEMMENQNINYIERERETEEVMKKQQQEIEEKEKLLKQQEQAFEEEKRLMNCNLQEQMEQQKIEHQKELERMRQEQERMKLEQEKFRQAQLKEMEEQKQQMIKEQQEMKEKQEQEKLRMQQELEYNQKMMEEQKRRMIEEQTRIKQENQYPPMQGFSQQQQPIMQGFSQQQQPIMQGFPQQQPPMQGFSQENQYPPIQENIPQTPIGQGNVCYVEFGGPVPPQLPLGTENNGYMGFGTERMGGNIYPPGHPLYGVNTTTGYQPYY
ncbi:alpha-actinin, putative [Entamoeba dispar SAW760]|uniref:Alpha-actinin, putative n=1 Tax=Entamoeba dispar (strain ATCC PRA-260 / SAW760) TaxID=370354 RepID=B0E898_ENTDS|nr:alpha-actinin, putative [Entamoeba dispar SAW760]EDR29223.1 alpha-actinin, putative [Entamoeba dispar SAW760]|eukprot:EDR29223.1 alpha-actinin, putative [Entamoeba dispar SAW760]